MKKIEEERRCQNPRCGVVLPDSEPQADYCTSSCEREDS